MVPPSTPLFFDRPSPRAPEIAPSAKEIERGILSVAPCAPSLSPPAKERPVTTLFANAYVVTMDDAGSEHEGGWILVDDGLIRSVGSGARPEADAVQDLDGTVVTPGLV